MQNHIQTNHSLFRLHCATLLLKGLVLGLRLVLSGTMILSLPQDLQIHALTYLRAADLGHVQISCRIFNEPNLIQAIIDKFANEVYPTELTEGFDTAVVGGERNATSCPGNSFWTSYEALRNMEMVVVARILSRPEPPVSERLKGGFYVSKSWCKSTLKWLDFQSEERRRKEKELADAKRSETIALSHNKKGKYNPAAKQKILLKKQHRKQNRKPNLTNGNLLSPTRQCSGAGAGAASKLYGSGTLLLGIKQTNRQTKCCKVDAYWSKVRLKKSFLPYIKHLATIFLNSFCARALFLIHFS